MRVAFASIVLVMAVVIGLLFYTGAYAAQEPEFGSGLACDTKEEAVEIITAADMTAVMEAINAREGKYVCGILATAYFQGPTVATFDTPGGLVEIRENTVIGISIDGKTINPVPPTVQYMPFLVVPKPAGLMI